VGACAIQQRDLETLYQKFAAATIRAMRFGVRLSSAAFWPDYPTDLRK
jgi:hypothetical protein